MSRKTMNVTAIIGTMTMSTKKSRNRVRKLDRRSRRSPMRPRSDIFRAAAYPRAPAGPQGGHRARLATIGDPPGAIAQLGERLDRTQEVGGSSPPSSTSGEAPLWRGFFVGAVAESTAALAERALRRRWPSRGPEGRDWA